MSFTLIIAGLAVLGLIIIFGLTYRLKGLKFAAITTGIVSAIFAVVLLGAIYVIVSVMSN